MILGDSLHDDYLISECYSKIVRIACLITFFEYRLAPEVFACFQNYKRLFSIGTRYDLPIIHLVLDGIENGVINDIWLAYSQYGFPVDRSNIWN